jgi:hypothetical protein
VQTRAKPGGGRSRAFTARISPIPRARYDFVKGRVARQVFATMRQRLGDVWVRALQRASAGAGGADE